jgi:hypothetical protein
MISTTVSLYPFALGRKCTERVVNAPLTLKPILQTAGPYIYAAWVSCYSRPCSTVEKIDRIVLQALTGVAGLALAFRYITKTWIRWILPRVSSPERVWGLEDILYGTAYAFDIAHMVFIQRRWAF